MNMLLTSYFETNNLFSNSQYGFRSGLSTFNVLNHLVESVVAGFENHDCSMSILCDLSRAFDCVSHETICSKLNFYGVKGKDLELIRSYLGNRTQVTSINGVLSKPANVKFGVPQGSVIGPLLFIIMINDLSFSINCDSVLFADDTSLFSVMRDHDNLVLSMETHLRDAANWFEANGFKLNKQKTQRILFTLKHVSDDMISTVRLLGITLDSRLTWAGHIDEVSKRLSRVLYLLSNLKALVSSNYLKQAYFAFFHSILHYGLLIWGNGANVNRILILQKKALRIITNSPYNAHCRPLFKQCNILTIVNQYIYDCLVFAKMNLNSHGTDSRHHHHSTRYKYLVYTPRARLTKTKTWLNVISYDLFNRLPRDAHSVTLFRFKVVVKHWLLDNPFYGINEYFSNTIDVKF